MGLITRRAALAGAAAALCPGLAPARPAPLKLKRGVNAFPWFQLTQEYPAPRRDFAWPPFQPTRPVPTARDLATLRAAGFDFLRIPVDPGPFVAAPAAQRRRLVDQLLAAVRLCLGHDLSVVVNVQANGGTHYWTPARLTASTEAPEFPAYLGLVRELAQRLPQSRVALEPINEPGGACGAKETAQVRAALLTAARKAAPDLTLVASGGCGSAIQGLDDFDPASVAAFAPVLYTFHFYEPFLFTHQGAPWIGERHYHTLSGVPWPGSRGSYAQTMAETRAYIDADATLTRDERAAVLAETEKVMKVYFDAAPGRPFIDGYLGAAAGWAKRHGIASDRVLMGEFGALRRDGRYHGARAADRARYIRDVRESAEAFGFPWAFWCLFDSMGLMDEATRALDPAMIAALGLRLG